MVTLPINVEGHAGWEMLWSPLKISSANTSFLFIHKHTFDSSRHLNGQVLCLYFCLESYRLYQEEGALWRRRSSDLRKGKYLKEMENEDAQK